MASLGRINRRWLKERIFSDYFILFLMASIYVLVVSTIAVLTHYSFYTNAWDLGIYSQALYTTVNHGRMLYYTPELTGNPSGSLFGIHFSPFLFLLAPLYALFQNPITLLVLRPIAISLGLIPLYWILRKHVSSNRRLTLIISAIYLIYPPVSSPFWNFDVEVFLPALFLFAIHYLREGELTHAYFFLILALTVNEFVPFLVIGVAIYHSAYHREEVVEGFRTGEVSEKAVFSVILFLSGILWLHLASSVITHYNPTALSTKWEWGELGTSPGEIAWNALSDPLRTIRALFSDGQKKFLYVVALLGPLAFFPLQDPLTLIMASPWLAASLLSVNPNYYSIESQYPSFISAFIFLAAVKGMKRLVNLNDEVEFRRFSAAMSISLLITFLLLPAGVHLGGTEEDGANRYALSLIPSNSSVSVMPEVFPHVCNRLGAYPYFQDGVDYVLVDVFSWWYDVSLPRPADPSLRWCEAEISDDYGIVVNSEGVLLYEKGYRGSIRLFKGVNFTFNCFSVEAATGRVEQDNMTVDGFIVRKDVLVHKAGDPGPLFFKVDLDALPPGVYNVTARLKASQRTPLEAIRFQLVRGVEQAEILSQSISGLEFSKAGLWQSFNLQFKIGEPASIEISSHVTDTIDLYFDSITISQISGVV